MVTDFRLTTGAVLLFLIWITLMIGLGYTVRLLKVNTRILREHRIRRAIGQINGDPDPEDQVIENEQQ